MGQFSAAGASQASIGQALDENPPLNNSIYAEDEDELDEALNRTRPHGRDFNMEKGEAQIEDDLEGGRIMGHS